MIRVILAIVGGVIVAFGLVMLTDLAVHAVGGSAMGAMPDPSDQAAMRVYMASAPISALATFAVGCLIAGFGGAWVAARFARRGAWPGWVVAALLLAATVANFVMVPYHPVWMMVASVAGVLVGGWLGARLGGRRRA